jgi:hypothetical protein
MQSTRLNFLFHHTSSSLLDIKRQLFAIRYVSALEGLFIDSAVFYLHDNLVGEARKIEGLTELPFQVDFISSQNEVAQTSADIVIRMNTLDHLNLKFFRDYSRLFMRKDPVGGILMASRNCVGFASDGEFSSSSIIRGFASRVVRDVKVSMSDRVQVDTSSDRQRCIVFVDFKRMLPELERFSRVAIRVVIKAERWARRLINQGVKLVQRIAVPFVGHTIQSGIFTGATIGLGYGSSHTAKIYGSYEECIQLYFKDLALRHSIFLDYGCADGYYLIGYKHLNPEGKVYGLDISDVALERARSACSEFSHCEIKHSDGSLDQISSHGEALIMLDCEGYEYQLLLENDLTSLELSSLIIEDHYFMAGHAPFELAVKLEKTHKVRLVIPETNAGLFKKELRHPHSFFLICEKKQRQ